MGMKPFGEAQSKPWEFREAQSKATRAYAQSGQYHTIVESRVCLTWY